MQVLYRRAGYVSGDFTVIMQYIPPRSGIDGTYSVCAPGSRFPMGVRVLSLVALLFHRLLDIDVPDVCARLDSAVPVRTTELPRRTRNAPVKQ